MLHQQETLSWVGRSTGSEGSVELCWSLSLHRYGNCPGLWQGLLFHWVRFSAVALLYWGNRKKEAVSKPTDWEREYKSRACLSILRSAFHPGNVDISNLNCSFYRIRLVRWHSGKSVSLADILGQTWACLLLESVKSEVHSVTASVVLLWTYFGFAARPSWGAAKVTIWWVRWVRWHLLHLLQA